MAGGRPSKYRKEYADQAYKLCLLGHTDPELAAYFETSEKTIDNWKNRHPEFLRALKAGKDDADGEVVASLYHRARGYSHEEYKIFIHEGEPVIVPTVKHYPPDTTAAISWLKNRQRRKWRDKHEIEHAGELTNNVIQVPGIASLDEWSTASKEQQDALKKDVRK